MSIQRREVNGKPRYVARVRDYTGREKSKTFDKRRDAMKWEAEILPIVKARGWASLHAGLTVGEAVKRRMESAERHNTMVGRRHLLKNLGPLSDMDVAKVKRGHVVHWAQLLVDGRPWLDGKPLARSTAVTMLGVLGAVFTHLVEVEAISQNPCAKVKVPVGRGGCGGEERLAPPVKEIERVISEGSERFGEGFGNAIRLAALTGLRASEVSAIQCRDVDLESGSIVVRRQLDHKGNIVPLKSRHSRRTVHLPEQVRSDFENRLEVAGDDDFVLLQMCGRPWTRKRLSNCLIALGAGFSFHALRHFCASSLIEAGVSIKAVQVLLGHASPSITMNVYAHLLRPSIDSVRSVNGALFAG